MSQCKSPALEHTVKYSLRLFVLVCFQEHLIENEVAVLRKVKHPNIIMLMEEVDTSSELYLVMELVKVQQRLVSMHNPDFSVWFHVQPLC